MDNILIALDYNPTAQKVAELGFALAQNADTAVTLLHVIANVEYYASSVYDPIMGFGGYVNEGLMPPTYMQHLTESSTDYLNKTKLHLGRDNIKILVKEGDLADTILATAKEINADVIVMGSHSKRWLDNILVGSITEKVLRHSYIPLFIIPTKK